MNNSFQEKRIAIIGLGYVGLPLALEFAKKYYVIGYDINEKRIQELRENKDHTLEADIDILRSVNTPGLSQLNTEGKGIYFSSTVEDIATCDTFIVTVPTPTDRYNRPVLTPLVKASEMVGSILKQGDIVIYESTVYPGLTEEECVPVLERSSGLTFNSDFFVGYSPERINPGDKEHTVAKIKKVTSGSTSDIAEVVDQLYRSVISAGTHKASSIKVAEAAKVIENAQRDINIAFVNELSKIFNLLEIDTLEVLEAAGTKWNFLPFRPGLVGGHCIGVDPYYLAQKAQEVGYHPEIILAGRRLNDGMGRYVASEVVRQMVKKDIPVKGSKVLMLGITFKENCPDIRNTRAIDIYEELQTYSISVDLYDPWVDPKEVKEEYNIEVHSTLDKLSKDYSAVILAVSHNEFKEIDFSKFTRDTHIVYDVKGVYPKEKVTARL